MKIYLKLFLKCLAGRIAGSVLLAGIFGNSMAQTVETAILQQFDQYRKNALQEKMFVHTDKNFYLAGEICWFKVYTVDAFFHKPIDISKVAYVELLDKSNKPVVQAKIGLEKGGGDGSVYVPVTINSGNYKLRVYSSWMKNFSADYFFEKTITIINTQQVSELPATQSTAAAYDIQFFPEGGNLVNGLPSKIAFRVVGRDGKGIDCNAVIVSDQKDTVMRFKTMKFGLGHFNFTPVSGQHYSAVFLLPNAAKVSKDLPVAYNSGYVMNLVEDGEKRIQITIRSIAEQVGDAPAPIYLFAHTRGSVKAALSSGLQNGTASFTIDKDKLGEGISHFTIFNSDRKPVCERLYFKYPARLNVKISTDQATYGLRQKISLGINSFGENAVPAEADMSMAVYRVDSLQLPGESGISEYLWLASDLPGTVESPAYYFDSAATPAVAEAMDNLMLTNGWRRFRWDDVLQSKAPLFKFAPEYNGHIITGKIVNINTQSPAANIKTFLSAPGTTRFRSSKSDEKGNLRFEMKNFYGTPGIILQQAEKDSGYRVEIDNPFSDQYAARSLPSFSMPAKNPATLLGRSIGMQVENIYLGDTLKKVNDRMIDTSSFYQQPDAIYLLDNYVRFATMEEVLREYVVPVNVRRKGTKYRLPVYNDADKFNGTFDQDPLVLLDGVPVFDMDKVIQYDPLKVRRLDAVTRRYYYGQSTFDGIVNLVTYNGTLEGYEFGPHAAVIDYEALQLEREFYSPVYETPQQAGSHLPDFRNVLSWDPKIKTGKDGKYHQNFYSSDLPGKYVAVIQALSADGKTGSSQVYFEVKKPLK
ncbi:MAG: hypothetical protein ABIQ31_14060 [Ferruginibacter sp.]